MVEHILGKDGVVSPILTGGTIVLFQSTIVNLAPSGLRLEFSTEQFRESSLMHWDGRTSFYSFR